MKYNAAETEPYAVALEPEWRGGILEPLMIQDDDEILLDEELSPEDVAQIERLQASWLREGRREAAQVRRDFKEDLNARAIDIVDHCHNAGLPLHSREAERAAAAAGYRQTTWSDQRNVTRRAQEATARVAGAVSNRRTAAAANTQDAPSSPAAPSAQPLPDIEVLAAVLPPILERYSKGAGIVKRTALWELAAARVNNRRPASFVSNITAAQRKDCDTRLAFAWREAVDAARREIERAAIAAGRTEDARVRVSASMERICRHYQQLRRDNAHPRLRQALDSSWKRQCHFAQKMIDEAATVPVPQDLTSFEHATCRAADGALLMARELLQRRGD